MQFQPSQHSFVGGPQCSQPSSALPDRFYTDEFYAGWFSNIWTREGRAENKFKRAKRKRKKGKTKAAERLERRAGVLKAKAAGKAGALHPQSDYTELWASTFPWAERRAGAGGIIGVAKGYRPQRKQVRQEWRATVLGALTALKAAGIEPYTSIAVENLPQKMLQSSAADDRLIKAVEQGTGKSFPSAQKGGLGRAAKAIRKVVVKHKLGRVAWPARAMPMLGASYNRAKITNISSTATGVGLTVASQVIGSAGLSPPWIQNIVTAPAAAILAIGSLISSGIGAGAATKKAIAKGKHSKYEQEFLANLSEWSFEGKSAQVQQQVAKSRARLAYQEAVAKKVGELRAQETVEAVKVIAWAGGVAFALVATSAAIGRARSSE